MAPTLRHGYQSPSHTVPGKFAVPHFEVPTPGASILSEFRGKFEIPRRHPAIPQRIRSSKKLKASQAQAKVFNQGVHFRWLPHRIFEIAVRRCIVQRNGPYLLDHLPKLSHPYLTYVMVNIGPRLDIDSLTNITVDKPVVRRAAYSASDAHETVLLSPRQ